MHTWRRRVAGPLLLLVLMAGAAGGVGEAPMIIEDRRHDDRRSALGTPWRAVTDGVMGGLSQARLDTAEIDGRPCLRLRGEVSLANNGGFVQMTLDLDPEAPLDASSYEGVLLEVRGNGATYNVHLKTEDVRLPWQSYRAGFQAPARWERIRLPFDAFSAHRIDAPLDRRRLRRLGLVAIGREMEADLCVARVELYRDGGGGD
jgi:hypothetical protein